MAVPYFGMSPSGKAISAKALFLAVCGSLLVHRQTKVRGLACSGVSLGPVYII